MPILTVMPIVSVGAPAASAQASTEAEPWEVALAYAAFQRVLDGVPEKLDREEFRAELAAAARRCVDAVTKAVQAGVDDRTTIDVDEPESGGSWTTYPLELRLVHDNCAEYTDPDRFDHDELRDDVDRCPGTFWIGENAALRADRDGLGGNFGWEGGLVRTASLGSACVGVGLGGRVGWAAGRHLLSPVLRFTLDRGPRRIDDFLRPRFYVEVSALRVWGDGNGVDVQAGFDKSFVAIFAGFQRTGDGAQSYYAGVRIELILVVGTIGAVGAIVL